jgi:hypothetical protein
MILSALDAPIGGIKSFFRPKKNGPLPLDLAYLECLSVIVAIQLQLMNN